MAGAKRRRKEDSPGGEISADSDSDGDTDELPCAPPSALLSAEEVQALSKDIQENCKEFITQLGTEKDQGRRSKMNIALTSVWNAYLAVSNAYLYKLGSDSAANFHTVAMAKACKRMRKTCDTLVDRAENNTLSQPSTQASSQSYAIATRNTTAASRKILLDQGKPIPIIRAKRVTVAPREDTSAKFPDSQATRTALYGAVDPVALQLRVKRVILSRESSSVVVEGDSLESLLNCKALSDVGLKVSSDTKMDPRVIIHGVPVEYDKNDIEKFISQNFPSISPDRFKVVYIYPAGTKKNRSCVVQMDSECREILFRHDRVSIGWQLCRFADHISILQCFNCLQFGHKATDCVNNALCGKCAQAHQTNKCKSNKQLCCANCKQANLSDSHSALDKAKCPTLRTKIERKASRINYGG